MNSKPVTLKYLGDLIPWGLRMWSERAEPPLGKITNSAPRKKAAREEGTYFHLLPTGLLACIALGNGMTVYACIMVDGIKHHFLSYLRNK